MKSKISNFLSDSDSPIVFPADLTAVASDILAHYGIAEDVALRDYYAGILSELSAIDCPPESVIEEHGDTLALMLFFSGSADSSERDLSRKALALIAFANRTPEEPAEFADFDLSGSQWWQTMLLKLEAIGDEIWSD